MKNSIQRFAVLVGCALFGFSAMAAGATFPDRPVRFITGFATGGSTDTLARVIGQRLTEMWGQSVVVESRPGADGSIAADFVAHAPPDGYTVVWVSNAHTVTPSQMKLNYDPLKSFTPITIAATLADLFLVNKTVPANTLKEFIAYARANPGKLNFGNSGGTGTSPYLEMVLLMNQTGMKMTNVSYKGGGPSMVGLLSNEIQLMFSAIPTSLSQVKAGAVKALAVSSATRSPLLPDVPTVAEAADLPGFSGGVWVGALAPAGIPNDIALKLNRDILAAIRSPSVQEQYAKLGFETAGTTPQEMASIIQSDIAKWAEVLKSGHGQ